MAPRAIFRSKGITYDLASIPTQDPRTYAKIRKADTLVQAIEHHHKRVRFFSTWNWSMFSSRRSPKVVQARSPAAWPGAKATGKLTTGTRAKVSKTAIPAQPKPAVRTGLERKSKKDQPLALIAKPNGARVSVIVERLGWQPHTVRAALSGLRKQGIAIVASKAPKTVYTIVTSTDEEGMQSESTQTEGQAS